MRIGIRIAALGAVFASSAFAWGSPEYFELLVKLYKLSDNSRIVGKSCATCHVSEEDFSLNPYGKDVKGQLGTPAAPLAEANLTAIESKDSDGDGAPNGDELRADSLPGDPTSYPEGFKPAPKAAAPKEETKPIIPKNAFHPAMVHFPIGLFIAGLILDLIGVFGGRREFLFAGWYNLVAAAITGLAGIATGFGAAYFMKFPLKGMVLNHLLLVSISVVFMWVMVSLRVHRHDKMNLKMRGIYYFFAILALAMLSSGGHLGGVMVYGD